MDLNSLPPLLASHGAALLSLSDYLNVGYGSVDMHPDTVRHYHAYGTWSCRLGALKLKGQTAPRFATGYGHTPEEAVEAAIRAWNAPPPSPRFKPSSAQELLSKLGLSDV